MACSLLYDKTFTSVIYKCSYCFRIRKQEEQACRILHGTAYVVLCPHHTNVSVQFRDLVGQYLRSLLTYHLKPWYVSLTDPYQNLIENTVQGPIYITMRKEKQNWHHFILGLKPQNKNETKMQGRKQALSQHLVRPCSKELLTTETGEFKIRL